MKLFNWASDGRALVCVRLGLKLSYPVVLQQTQGLPISWVRPKRTCPFGASVTGAFEKEICR